MSLAEILRRYQQPLLSQYGSQLGAEQRRAMQAILRCHTPQAGQLDYVCPDCDQHKLINHSCGHRSCPQCGHNHNQQWLQRQQQKLLPSHYYLMTFTLPQQLRGLAQQHQRSVYRLLMRCAVDTVQTFAANDKQLGGKLGISAVLHTHARNLDYHPHVHLIVSAGCMVNQHGSHKKTVWRQKDSRYLFNGKALGKVFRGKFLAGLSNAGLHQPKIPPKQWIAHCKNAGHGGPALIYLSRYLYRGAISENNIIALKNGRVTYQYKDSKTKRIQRRCEPATKFLWRLLQHVLPKGFHRCRDYGFLSAAAKQSLQKLQRLLKVNLCMPAQKISEILCPCCGHAMHFLEYLTPVKVLLRNGINLKAVMTTT